MHGQSDLCRLVQKVFGLRGHGRGRSFEFAQERLVVGLHSDFKLAFLPTTAKSEITMRGLLRIQVFDRLGVLTIHFVFGMRLKLSGLSRLQSAIVVVLIAHLLTQTRVVGEFLNDDMLDTAQDFFIGGKTLRRRNIVFSLNFESVSSLISPWERDQIQLAKGSRPPSRAIVALDFFFF